MLSSVQISNFTRYRIYCFIWQVLDWVYPPYCGGCGNPGSRWCFECDGKVSVIHPPYCERCGAPTPGTRMCERCEQEGLELNAIRAYGIYEEPLRTAIHRLKYHRDIALAEVFSKKLVEIYHQNRWDVDVIIPVPLSIVRLKERGYNQSALLAYPLSLMLGKPYHRNALRRVRETESQVNLTVRERQANVEGAFWADEEFVSNKRILLVDDVCTTGSTLNECAKALKNANAESVYGITLARART